MKKRVVDWLRKNSLLGTAILLIGMMILIHLSVAGMERLFCWCSGISVTLIGDTADDYASSFLTIGMIAGIFSVWGAMRELQDMPIPLDAKRAIFQIATGLLATAGLVICLLGAGVCRWVSELGLLSEARFIRGAEICFCLSHLMLGKMFYGYLVGLISWLKFQISEANLAEIRNKVNAGEIP